MTNCSCCRSWQKVGDCWVISACTHNPVQTVDMAALANPQLFPKSEAARLLRLTNGKG